MIGANSLSNAVSNRHDYYIDTAHQTRLGAIKVAIDARERVSDNSIDLRCRRRALRGFNGRQSRDTNRVIPRGKSAALASGYAEDERSNVEKTQKERESSYSDGAVVYLERESSSLARRLHFQVKFILALRTGRGTF